MYKIGTCISSFYIAQFSNSKNIVKQQDQPKKTVFDRFMISQMAQEADEPVIKEDPFMYYLDRGFSQVLTWQTYGTFSTPLILGLIYYTIPVYFSLLGASYSFDLYARYCLREQQDYTPVSREEYKKMLNYHDINTKFSYVLNCGSYFLTFFPTYIIKAVIEDKNSSRLKEEVQQKRVAIIKSMLFNNALLFIFTRNIVFHIPYAIANVFTATKTWDHIEAASKKEISTHEFDIRVKADSKWLLLVMNGFIMNIFYKFLRK